MSCPRCGGPTDPRVDRCPYCGESYPDKRREGQERWLQAYTQGMSPEGYSDGNYDVVDYPAMPLSQALEMLKRLPVPPRVDDPGSYCPPAVGFGERQISRMDDGRYFLWPEDRTCSLEEARQVVFQIYGQN